MKLTNLLLAIIALVTGCASEGNYKNSNATGVNLAGNNYRIVKAGATGSSSGFYLLGLIPFASPNYGDAKARIYQNVPETLTGRSIALINQTEDRSVIYLIFFSVPKVTITADVIEFTGAAIK